ncbi:MAG: permease of the major facilitator superfamily [Naasia sp.]|jgi:MFS family permease|uniref:MFS transporter n=1 Tax=Naasia sp. TaxID=2546198 RepID=UPI0026128C78|nr:MFS transporter [Naasia sp.]MCU1571320.1 permease of the major facilitator superfamily [Naasia sp.]
MAGEADRDRRRLSRMPNPRVVVAVLALAGMSASFMQTIVLPIQAELPELLDASREDTAWVITATLLSAAVVTPIAGRLGDMYGKRRIALALLAVLVLGSVIAALSHDINLLIVGRALQGAVVGVIPLGISILRDVLHEDRLGGAIALVSATLGVGGALGLPISALVSDNFDWHVLFWLAAGLGVIDVVLVAIFVPVSTLRSPGGFDLLGAIGLALGLSGVLLAASRGNEWGWLSPLTLGLGLGGIALLLAWGWYELRAPNPLVDLRVAARAPVLLTNLASVAMGFALFSSNVAFPQLLELPVETGVGLGLSLLTASLVLMPSGLVMMVMSPISARLTRTIGPRVLLVGGALFLVLSYALSLLAVREAWQVLLINVVIGVGIGLGYAAMPTLIMRSVPASETAAANGLNALMRSLGTSFASAAIGAILAVTSVQVGDAQVPSAEGFRLAFVLGGVAALLAAVLAFFIPRSTRGIERRPSLPDA